MINIYYEKGIPDLKDFLKTDHKVKSFQVAQSISPEKKQELINLLGGSQEEEILGNFHLKGFSSLVEDLVVFVSGRIFIKFGHGRKDHLELKLEDFKGIERENTFVKNYLHFSESKNPDAANKIAKFFNSQNAKILETKLNENETVDSFAYHGGHPDLSDSKSVHLHFSEKGIHIKSIWLADLFVLPWAEIQDVTVKVDHVQKDSALGGILSGIGLMGMGNSIHHAVAGNAFVTMGNKPKLGKEHFVFITYERSGIKGVAIFEAQEGFWGNKQPAAKAVAIINKYRIKYCGEIKAVDISQNNKSPDAVKDPIEQIKKLKELLDLGAITETEYVSKKEALLKKVA